MKLDSITINHYRSIDHVEIKMPEEKPLILFGPNNAGKSNILSAINRVLGERYPTYVEMLDSDYYMRDKENYPTSEIVANFDSPLFTDKYNNPISTVSVTYGFGGDPTNNLLHNGYGKQIYPRTADRAKCQSFLIDAERNIQGSFSYSSKYSLMSKFSHKIHDAIKSDDKKRLSEAFDSIKTVFEGTPEFKNFFADFSETLNNSVKGFVHSLAVDFSAYDPNNYAKSMRIFAKEGENMRSFEEFGTGEQQVLLMAFVKAYMEIFTSESFVLIIEEPEAHLHPLAQRWLKEHIVGMCKEGIQIVISTHSTEFIDPECLEGLVRVYKNDGKTEAIQLTKEQLYKFCVESGTSPQKATPENIIKFYSTKMTSDQLRGVFATTVIFVEGSTEYHAIPEFMKKTDFSLAEHGVEIVNCMGKNSIPLFWRLYKAYGYTCFAIFDSDQDPKENDKVFIGLIDEERWMCDEDKYAIRSEYAYFGKDFESYFKTSIDNYDELKRVIEEEYKISSKPGIAKAIAELCDNTPSFITELTNKLIALDA